MNVRDLMGTPLMRNASVIAGEGGMLNDVTWAVPDQDLQFENWIMPGLLIVCTHDYRDCDSWIAYLSSLIEAKVAAVAWITGSGDPDSPNIEEEALSRIVSWHNHASLPLIAITKPTNITSFLKNFALTASSWFRRETQVVNWLQDICTYSTFPGAEALAAHYDYNPNYGYYASILSLKNTAASNRVLSEMELNMIQSFLQRELGFKDAPVLSFATDGYVVAFLPRPPQEERLAFRNRVEKAMRKPHSEISGNKWRLAVGTRSRDITMFNESYVNAMNTKSIVEKLGISDRIAYYNDFYMHMLLLDKPTDALREQMEYVLNPILDKPELLETLTNYLVFGESLKVASEKTFIHVNTLKYRLGRIGELLACDLKDPNIRFKLRMAITIYRYLEGSKAAFETPARADE